MNDRYELLTSSVFSVYQSVLKIQRAEMVKFGLKGAHVSCLWNLSAYPEGLSVTQLSRLMEKDKAAVSRELAELEKKGFVVPESVSAGGYRTRLRLTERGREAAEFVRQRVAVAVRKAGAGLLDENREIFYSALALIASNLQNICQEGLDR